MPGPRYALAFALLCLTAAGCRERQSDLALDGGPSADAAPDAAIPPPPELSVSVIGHVPDAGAIEISSAGDPGARPEIPPVDALSVETNVPLQNYRIRVFDEVDRAMVSDDQADDTDGGVRYRIAFPEPLKTGHAYTLVIDAESGPELVDGHGRAQPDVRVEFKIAGEKEKPPPPRKRRRR